MCIVFVVGNIEFVGIFFVQKFDFVFYFFSVGIISLVVINYVVYIFFCVYGFIIFIDECREEVWIVGVVLFCLVFGGQREQGELFLGDDFFQFFFVVCVFILFYI